MIVLLKTENMEMLFVFWVYALVAHEHIICDPYLLVLETSAAYMETYCIFQLQSDL